MHHHRSAQRGLSFFGVVIVGAVLVFGFVVGAKVAPTVIEYQAIRKAVDKSTAGTTVAEVRAIFDRAAAIDDISSIKGSDLTVGKEGDKVVVSFAYNKEIELFPPAYLLLKYVGKSK
ncbi:DUF4845 domain-containing protein [Pseudorhodoferax sp. Leaf267]|uniref:DUF4845 domain-containing protein n=1 Tax=Pseudorhodoferax sp. Leaf267 TaxID=1736316 RepID=UPI0006FEFC33|nr:DUF4845 domain-containing protein [Pseudorhodoferax sp. Leaf267]KQP14312.1 hypothetical protein ASF43_15980 [Pseudorhodoferax sp. Leaf267]